MAIKTEDFLLPVGWSAYLINGDATGYEDHEFEAIEEWVTCNAPGPCLDVGEASFCWRGDDSMDLIGIARAFANGQPGHCHNARTDGTKYVLHDSPIAVRHGDAVVFHWHGFYTHSTANHMNHILRAFGADFRVSYAQARDKRETHFVLELERFCKEAV